MGNILYVAEAPRLCSSSVVEKGPDMHLLVIIIFVDAPGMYDTSTAVSYYQLRPLRCDSDCALKIENIEKHNVKYFDAAVRNASRVGIRPGLGSTAVVSCDWMFREFRP